MDYSVFYDITKFANKEWWGGYNEKEIASLAHLYTVEFEKSVERGEKSNILIELYSRLKDDGSEECKEWVEKLRPYV